jgi:hypothetical protein
MRAHEFVNEAISIRKAKRMNPGRLSFKGYRCTKDCSGHRAGYAWAARRGISSPNQMPQGNSNSFWEGGKAYGQGR